MSSSAGSGAVFAVRVGLLRPHSPSLLPLPPLIIFSHRETEATKTDGVTRSQGAGKFRPPRRDTQMPRTDWEPTAGVVSPGSQLDTAPPSQPHPKANPKISTFGRCGLQGRGLSPAPVHKDKEEKEAGSYPGGPGEPGPHPSSFFLRDPATV